MVEAKLNKEYALRIAGIGLLMCCICVWSMYDGIAAWPRVNRNMDSIRPALLAKEMTAEGWLARDDANETPLQAAFAAENMKVPAKLVKKVSELRVPAGSPVPPLAVQIERLQKIFNDPVYTQHELNTQFVQAAVTLCLGLAAFLSLTLKARKSYVADDTGLSGSGIGKAPAAYEDIASIDWSKWDEKGILVLRLKNNRRLRLDGWHFSGITGIVGVIKHQRPDLCAS